MVRYLTLISVLLVAMTADGSENAASPYGSPVATQPVSIDSPIDRLVQGQLDRLKIRPANLCSDSVFVRRVYLDVIGTLPTEQEAREFILDKSPTKRAELIDRLLVREEFAQYWAMKWSDLLRVKAEFPINLWPNAAQGYHHWILDSIRHNKPYDRFVRELLTASGSNFRVPQANFYRAMQNRQPEGIAQTVALTFMGVRTEKWPKDRLAGMTAFFSQVGFKSTLEWKEEIVYWDLAKAVAATTRPATQPSVFPDGRTAKLTIDRDPRDVFADWLVDPKNPWFSRNIANRVWCWLLGRGIIHEADDIRPDNPPSNPELLAYLQRELANSHYDLKHLYRLILNSRTYQSSCVPASSNSQAAAGLAYYPLRRLDAEVLIDALNQITGTSERYSSPIPEPYTFIPENVRSISLPDGSISSSFLELFGRPSRDTGLESERVNRTSAAGAMHLLNSSHIQNKLEQGKKLQDLIRGGDADKTITRLYLTILSRFPMPEELRVAQGHYKANKYQPRQAAMDIAWALINSDEFLYRH